MQNIEKAFLEYLKSDVDISMALGLPDHLGELGDPGIESLKMRNIRGRTFLAEIESEPVPEDFHAQIDLDLMKRFVKLDLFFNELTLDGELRRERLPMGVDGISEGIFQLFVNDEREPKVRLDNILSRLKQAPDHLAEELRVLRTPVKRWRDIEIAQAAALPELFDTILNWAKEKQYDQVQELRVQVDAAKNALENYIEGLKKKGTTGKFAIGIDKVKELLELRQIGKTPEELRLMAETFMKETLEVIETLRVRLNSKYDLPADTDVVALQEHLNNHFTVELKEGRVESILDHYRSEKAKIHQFIRERELFEIPEDQEMVILQTPKFLEPVIPAGAMWPPLALREGTKKSLVYLTLKEDELAEHTHLGIPVMMVHEGIPGHHLQLATAALHSSLIRRIYGANEHAEGWTTMLEDYMLDQGYVERDLVDEVRFIAKREMSRLIARVGIDLYFMTGDISFLNVGINLDFDSEDPFENAAKLLKTATGFTDGRVQAELNWYSKHHGYPLSYLTGNRLVWELKKEIVQLNKKGLSEENLDREFHRIYLESGNMPVATLRELFRHEGLL